MITMHSLGRNGRLGNQLFQYAYLFALSKRNKYELVLPRLAGLDQFKISASVGFTRTSKECRETRYCDCDRFALELLTEADDTDYWGYFQSEKYFEDCEAGLRQELRFVDAVVEKVDRLWGGKYEQLTAVHIRRGDVVKEGNALPLDYYEKAMRLSGGSEFIVVSDQPEWCRDHIRADHYSVQLSPAEDCYLMSRCSRLVISSSSISWWADWLNPSCLKTIAPCPWRCGVSHVFRPDWELLNWR